MEENTREIRDQEEYNRCYSKMDKQCGELEIQIKKIKDEILEQSVRKEKIRRFLDELRQINNLVTEFDENLWNATVELATINQDKTLTFIFRDATKITVKAAKTK